MLFFFCFWGVFSARKVDDHYDFPLRAIALRRIICLFDTPNRRMWGYEMPPHPKSTGWRVAKEVIF